MRNAKPAALRHVRVDFLPIRHVARSRRTEPRVARGVHYGCEAMEQIIAAAEYTYIKEHDGGSRSFISRIDGKKKDKLSELVSIEIDRDGDATPTERSRESLATYSCRQTAGMSWRSRPSKPSSLPVGSSMQPQREPLPATDPRDAV